MASASASAVQRLSTPAAEAKLAFAAADEQHFAKAPSTGAEATASSVYDIYHDANIAESLLLVPPVQALLDRLEEFCIAFSS